MMSRRLPVLAAFSALLFALVAVWNSHGSVGQQQLPGPWKNSRDDVQYFPPGPDFNLNMHIEAAKEAARIRESRQHDEDRIP